MSLLVLLVVGLVALRATPVLAQQPAPPGEADAPVAADAEPAEGPPQSPADALAQDAVARAKLHYDEAVLLYEQGEFEAAARALEQAYVLDPHPVLAFNIARAWDDAGDFQSARKWYLAALSEGELGELERKRAAKALERIDNTEQAFRSRVEELKLTESRIQVTSTQNAARVFVDGELVGETPFSRVVEAGAYTIRVEADGFEPYSEVVEPSEGETIVVRAALEIESLLPWVYALGGVSAVALGVAVAGDVLAVEAYDEAERNLDDLGKLEDHKAFGKDMRVMAIVGYSVAAVAGAAGVVLLLVELTGGGIGENDYRTLGALLLGPGTPVDLDLGVDGASLRVVW